MDTEGGLKLTSPDALDDLSAKCNIIYVICAIVGALFLGNILIGVCMGLLLGWCIKGPMILKSASYKFRTMEFAIPNNVSLEEIYKSVSQTLHEQEIETVFQENELSFQHGSIHYQYLTDGTEGTFRLRWYYSVSKALFGSKYISDYKVIRKDTGLIAYTIQNIMDTK